MVQSDKQYFKDFFEENKSIQNGFIVKDKKGMTHIFDREQVLVEILNLPASTMKKVRTKFVQIDFRHGNINHFINYLLKGLVK